jgi:predicted ribosomally synthesized peptide with SipW-like signal peptide
MAMTDKVEISMKKFVLLSVIIVAITATIVGVGTFAYFSATQVSGVNNFHTGSISFSVNGADPWAGNFNATLSDVKPGMTGWGNVTLQNTGQNPADLWLMIANITTISFGDNTAKKADTPTGYPHIEIDNFINYGLWNYTGTTFPATANVNWRDYYVGYNTSGSAKVPIAPLANNVSYKWIYLGVVQPGAANALNVNESFTLNKTVTNWAQLTNMTFTVYIYAQQSQGTPAPDAPQTELALHTRGY